VTRLSACRRAVARGIAIVLLVAGWAVPLAFPHAPTDDLLCLDGLTPGGSASARLNVATGRSAPDHCVICHTARTFRTSLAEASAVALGLAPGAVLALWVQVPTIGAAFDLLPARAPPLA
jgi:mono/diheme cytochrome c family protein